MTGSLISISRLFISREPVIFSFPVVLDDQVSLSYSAVDFDNNLRYCGYQPFGISFLEIFGFVMWDLKIEHQTRCTVCNVCIWKDRSTWRARRIITHQIDMLLHFDFHLHSLNIRTSKSGYHYLRFMLKRSDKVISEKKKVEIFTSTSCSPFYNWFTTCFYHISRLSLFFHNWNVTTSTIGVKI